MIKTLKNNGFLGSERLKKMILLLSLLIISVIYPRPFWPKAGWLILAVLISLDTDFGIYASFYLSAFFIGTGFFANPYFTLKHFHIAIGLTALVLLLKGKLIPILKTKHSAIFDYLLWMAIAGISMMAWLFDGSGSTQILRTSGNLLLLVLSALILICAVPRKDILINAMYFYAFGVAVRILLACFPPYKSQLIHSTEMLLFNNHLGFLASSSIFPMVSVMIYETKRWKQILISLVIGITFFGVLSSCSRTGWLSVILAFCIFLILNRPFFLSQKMHASFSRAKRILFLTLGGFILVLIIGLVAEPVVLNRIMALTRLLKLDYWDYTFRDQQNFGFLGFFRLHQFSIVGSILSRNWLFGIGLERQVTDFHSLYLTILGGTGVLGLACFLWFCFSWVNRLLKQLRHSKDRTVLVLPGIFCAFVVWLVYSFLESFFLQFHIWSIFVMGSTLVILMSKQPPSHAS